MHNYDMGVKYSLILFCVKSCFPRNITITYYVVVVLMTEKIIKLTASFIWECLEIRRHTLYTSS